MKQRKQLNEETHYTVGEIFVSCKYDRKLMFKAYNELKKLNIKRTNNLIYKKLRKGTNTCQDINNGKKEKRVQQS